jgi:hypothetical protein
MLPRLCVGGGDGPARDTRHPYLHGVLSDLTLRDLLPLDDNFEAHRRA